jgi:hypothetical protein
VRARRQVHRLVAVEDADDGAHLGEGARRLVLDQAERLPRRVRVRLRHREARLCADRDRRGEADAVGDHQDDLDEDDQRADQRLTSGPPPEQRVREEQEVHHRVLTRRLAAREQRGEVTAPKAIATIGSGLVRRHISVGTSPTARITEIGRDGRSGRSTPSSTATGVSTPRSTQSRHTLAGG